MKNISIILNVVLIIAVTLLYIDRFSGNDKEELKAVNENVAENSGKIAYVNIDSLLNGYDYYNDKQTEFLKEQQKQEAKLNSKGKALERKAMEFQNKVQKGLVTSNQAQQMQNQLMREQQNLMQLKDQISMDMMNRQQQTLQDIYQNIVSAIKEYNKNGKYKMILGNTGGQNVLVADSALNITEIIVEKLNEEYQQKQANSETKDNK
jgi:outer membrane protein